MKMCCLHPQGQEAHSSKNSNYLPDYTALHPTSIRTSISHTYMYRWTSRCSVANIICVSLLCCETHLKFSQPLTNTLCIMKMLILHGSSYKKTRHSVSIHMYLRKYTYATVSRNVELYFNLQFLTRKGLKMVSCTSSINMVYEKLLISLHWIPFIFKWYMYSMFMSSICQTVKLLTT